MICPYCKPKRGGHNDFDLSDLFDHVLDRHPKEMIKAARGMIKDQAIEFTDVEFQEGKDGT